MIRLERQLIKVLIVEDSPSVAEFLSQTLRIDPNIEVVGIARDGNEALAGTRKMRPDVITMDIHMPQMNGFEATRNIMEACPTPIVVVSSTLESDKVAINFRALEAGALAVLALPNGVGHPNHDFSTQELVNTVKLMSEVKVVRRWQSSKPRPVPVHPEDGPSVTAAKVPIRIVAMGASTGGPPALQTILSKLPKPFPVPIVIVQHMTRGFIHGFADWLATSSGIPVKVASEGEPLLPGQVYVAPDGFNMGISFQQRIQLCPDDKKSNLCPSVSFLLRTVEAVYKKGSVSILLTGMGNDGVDGLKELNEGGAITIAQDEESSVVHGMPGQAIAVNAATYILPPLGIVKALEVILSIS